MAAIANPTAPQFIQQAFDWDALESSTVAVASPSNKSATTANGAVVRSKRTSRPPVTVPSISSSTSFRRGRCEHVGGLLATVLERYGIGIDQLLAEIDGLK